MAWRSRHPCPLITQLKFTVKAMLCAIIQSHIFTMVFVLTPMGCLKKGNQNVLPSISIEMIFSTWQMILLSQTAEYTTSGYSKTGDLIHTILLLVPSQSLVVQYIFSEISVTTFQARR